MILSYLEPCHNPNNNFGSGYEFVDNLLLKIVIDNIPAQTQTEERSGMTDQVLLHAVEKNGRKKGNYGYFNTWLLGI